MSSRLLRLGTRNSLLARAQSSQVADRLQQAVPGLRVELVPCISTGDRIQDRPLHDIGGKGLFTKELEEALLRGEIDFAVHSLKDVPVTQPLVDPAGLVLAAIPARYDPRDVLVSSSARSLEQLPKAARVGTGSLRRQSQLLFLRPDLKVEGIRGNIDTRLRKMRSGEFDAVLLAMAGLMRADLWNDADMMPLSLDQFLPAAGQGALALQCRAGDASTHQILSVLDDPATRLCVELERAVVEGLQGDCRSPIAVLAALSGEGEQAVLSIRAAVGGRDGAGILVRAAATGPATDRQSLLHQVESLLKEQGAERLLHSGGWSRPGHDAPPSAG